MFRTIQFIGMLLIASTFSGCNTNNSNVPNVPVNLQVIISNPQFINLQAVGGYAYVTGGSKGIIIYRFSINEFRAYERHCPYNVKDGCRVTVNNTSIEAEDDVCCGSRFLIVDGSVIEGPSAFPLKGYQTSFDGNTLRIFN